MRGAADVRRISLKAIDFAARLARVRSTLSSARASKMVTGVLVVALAAAALHEALDIRWALGASVLATSSGQGSPSSRSSESAARSQALQALLNAHLFGLAPAPEGRLAAAQRDTTLVLTGTIATRHPSSGLAIIGASAETAHVHPVGDSLARGVVLRAVYRDHVVVERSGQLSLVFFPRSGKAALTAAIPPHASRGVRGSPDDGDSEELQRQRIEDAIEAESERTSAFVRQQPFYADGQLRGIVLQPGSDPAMLAQLGLKAGDVLEWVDGSVIAQPDRLDWLRQRLESGQPVDLSVIRPGSGQVDVKIPGGAVAGMIEN
jgi:type II secretion system protein C